MKPRSLIRSLLLPTLLSVVGNGLAAEPGVGVTVRPLKSSLTEEAFQTVLVMKALEKLGYDVKTIKDIDYAAGHVEIANGDATFMANHWDPLHTDFFELAGGNDKIYRRGVYSTGALQGYMIDKVTADNHAITNLAQFKDPKIAALFDADGNGRADLVGCTTGWACKVMIDHHLQAYGLLDTVEQKQGDYSTNIAGSINRYRQEKPILYYTWTPYWVSGVLVPNEDVVWLQVPFSSLPGARKETDTALPDGSNYGFQANRQRIIANQTFTESNPAAAKLFEIMELSANDISTQNLRIRDGEKSTADIERHADEWIHAHQATFDGWIKAAEAAAR